MIVTGIDSQVREFIAQQHSAQVGFVPTMGFLHEGHLSLVRRAREANDLVIVSIFVNPSQFAPDEDLESYPRDLERDMAMLSELHVDLVFTPDAASMYGPDFQTNIRVDRVSKQLEGRSRPTHFQGVATVVAKLFNIVRPNRAYFGQKDAQQCVVLKRMVEDLNFNLEIVVCPIVREHDGLAMSSRNVRLSADDRKSAPIVYQALLAAFNAYLEGERDAGTLRKAIEEKLSSDERARVDYISVADPTTLEELVAIERGALLSTAVFFGDVRLIDNILME